jgi:hypothetical protein
VNNTDRRHTERHPAGDTRAQLLWADGPNVRQSPARLLDVSRDGARFVSELSPPLGRDICFRLEVPRRSGWVAARVVRAGEAMEGGLRFSGYCPHDLITGSI